MIDIESLRAKILDLAIRGKLTQQLVSDGTAKDLLVQIKAEKEKLIAEGKIKKEKPLAPITDDEKPFDIPESWTWVRLGNIFCVINGDRGENYPAKTKLSQNGEIPFISAINFANGKIKKEGLLFLSNKQYDKLRAGKLQKGDFVVCIRGSLGKYCRFDLEQGAIASSLVILRKYLAQVSDEYFEKFLKAPILSRQINNLKNGAAQPNLSAKNFETFIIPLPPLAEQKRIVEIIETFDETLQLINKLELSCKQDAEILKNKLISAAVRGKLTQQLVSDGTVKDLLAQIKAEKEKLIAEGKIKKEKKLAPITDNEKPFDIPENWEWVRLYEIFEVARGGSPRPISAYLTNNTNGLNWIKISDSEIGGKYINSTKEKIIPEGLHKTRFVHKGDFLLTNSMSYGRPYILNTDGCIHDGWLVLSPYLKDIVKDFFFYLISSNYIKMEFAYTVAGGVVKNLNSDKVREIFIPLPPLAEQKRIVEKLDKLLAICNQIVAQRETNSL